MDMKQTATQVVKQLQDAGHQAVFAGGCVRDMLLGVEPSDFDVSTSATPDQVERIFSHTVAVGKSFGVIRVLMGNHEIEVATFRTDNRSSDGRHPDSVTFSTSMEEDVKRRDLTVNALLMNPVSGEIFDFVGGQEDLRIKRIRFVGVANDRIEEDALRMLRAVRFAVKFDATLTGEDSQAIVDNAFRVEVLSGERIFDEMTKILRLHKARRALNMLSDLGLLSLILPEIEALKTCEHGACTFHLEGSVWNHLMLVLEALPKDASDELLWGTLLHDVGKPATQKPSKNHPGAFAFHGHDNVGAEMAIDLLRRMKCSNDFIFTVSELVRGHMKMHLMAELKMHTARRLLAEPFIEDLMKLGITRKMPVMISVQAEGSNNLVANITTDLFISRPSKTIADSISVDIPRNFYMSVEYIKTYNGQYVTVSDEEIIRGSILLSRSTGIFSEPAAAAAFAGMIKYRDTNKIPAGSKVVVMLTGSGLKDLKSVQSSIRLPSPIEPVVHLLKQIFN